MTNYIINGKKVDIDKDETEVLAADLMAATGIDPDKNVLLYRGPFEYTSHPIATDAPVVE